MAATLGLVLDCAAPRDARTGVVGERPGAVQGAAPFELSERHRWVGVSLGRNKPAGSDLARGTQHHQHG